MRWLMTFNLAMLIGFLSPASGRLVPYVPDWPHRLTKATLTGYVNKTFGPLQWCLKVAADDTAEAAAIVAMLHPQRVNDSAGGHSSNANAPTRTIALDACGDVPVFCTAYMVIGRRLETIQKYFEYFRSDMAERMLVIVIQSKKYIKPFIKVSSIAVHSTSPKSSPKIKKTPHLHVPLTYNIAHFKRYIINFTTYVIFKNTVN